MSSSYFALIARRLSVVRAGTTVLDGVDLAVGPDDRIGIIGANGVGKSTLLAALAGGLVPDGGTVERQPTGLTVGRLVQEPERRPGETGRALLARRTGVAAATGALEQASHALAASAPTAADDYGAALDAWTRLGAADLDARADAVWAGLGLDQALLDQPTTTLSGGEAARTSLAAVLLSRFDVLLLDEPTNDLDYAGLAQLEEFLAATSAAVVLVSHDRELLARAVDDVVELDEHTRRATRYRGGWEAYLAERATARRHAEEAHATYRDRHQRLTERAARQRRWSQAGVRTATRSGETDKFIRHRNVQASERVAAKARATERALERLDPVAKPWEGWELRLDLGAAPRSGDVVAELVGAVVERGRFRLGPIDLELGWGERVALAGSNGSGKTTLVGALLGRVPLTAGTRRLGPSVVVGELDQARSQFTGAGRLIDAAMTAIGLRTDGARSLLAKFGLGADHVDRPAERLSPGERTRAGLAALVAGGANLLVLDEPTNHLDIPAIEQLEVALGTWTGTLLVISHDRRFLDGVHLDRTIAL